MYWGIVHKHVRSLSPDSRITFQWKNLSLKSPFESKQTTHKVPYDPLHATYRWLLSEDWYYGYITMLRKKLPLFSPFLKLQICIWGKTFEYRKKGVYLKMNHSRKKKKCDNRSKKKTCNRALSPQ